MSAIIERLPQTSSATGAGRRAVVKAAFLKAAGHLRALATQMTRRQQVFALGRLDDRMLADIGLTRSDLAAASRWSLWGDPGERLAAISEERRAARLSQG